MQVMQKYKNNHSFKYAELKFKHSLFTQSFPLPHLFSTYFDPNFPQVERIIDEKPQQVEFF
jgi:hypothetical protein